MMISLASYVIFCYIMKYTVLTDSDIYAKYYDVFYWTSILLFVFTIILAYSLLYLEDVFWFCCSCFLEAKQEILVHDPDYPDKTFKLVDKDIIEVHDETELMMRTEINRAVSFLTTPAFREIVDTGKGNIEMAEIDQR